MTKSFLTRLALLFALLGLLAGCGSGSSDIFTPPSGTCVWDSSTWDTCTWGP